MSRQVPFDRALSDDDRRYLRMLGAYGGDIERRIDGDYPPDPEALAEFERAERKTAAEMNGQGLTSSDQADLVAENDRLKAQLAELMAASAEDSQPYKPPALKADLEAEVDRVNAEDPEAKLSKGTVAEMQAALVAYFTE